MVDPSLHASLHIYFLEPVDVVGCGFVVGRLGDQIIYFFLRIRTFFLDALAFHPCDELRMINDVFLECVSAFIHVVDMDVDVGGIHLASAFVYRHEDRFDT